MALNTMERTARSNVLEPLTREGIETRLKAISAIVASVDGLPAEDPASLAPRWIAAAELVRRVKPFLSMN